MLFKIPKEIFPNIFVFFSYFFAVQKRLMEWQIGTSHIRHFHRRARLWGDHVIRLLALDAWTQFWKKKKKKKKKKNEPVDSEEEEVS